MSTIICQDAVKWMQIIQDEELFRFHNRIHILLLGLIFLISFHCLWGKKEFHKRCHNGKSSHSLVLILKKLAIDYKQV